MGRIWRNEAGIVLLAYFIACVAGLGCAALGHPGPRAQQTPLAQQAPLLLFHGVPDLARLAPWPHLTSHPDPGWDR